MAVSLEDLVAGTLAFQTFVANAKHVEMIVNVAFAVVPTILGFGAAGLIGHGVISTAREVMHSISMLRAMGPALRYGMDVHKFRKNFGAKLQQSNNRVFKGAGIFLAPYQWAKSKREKNNQDTQGKQDEQGGGGGSPPVPPPDPRIILKPTDELMRKE